MTLTRLALARLEQGFGDRPGLLVLHYIPPHAPYLPTERFDIFANSS